MTFPISEQGRALLILGALSVFLATVVVCARFWSRYLKKAGCGLDDWFSLAALPCFYAQVATHTYAVIAGGLGFHEWQNSAAANRNIIKSTTIIQYPYALSLLFVRFSICMLLHRIFIQRWLRACMYFFIFLNLSMAINLMIFATLVCKPLAYNWDPSIKGGSCNESVKNRGFAAIAAYSIVYDVAIWIIPQALVWKLHTTRANKLALSAIFALGILDTVVAIIRFGGIRRFNENDYSHTIAPQQLCTVGEVGIGFIVSNAPVIRPAIDACLSRLRACRRHRKCNTSSRAQTSDGGYGQLDNDGVRLTKNLRLDRGKTATTIEANTDTENNNRKSFSNWF